MEAPAESQQETILVSWDDPEVLEDSVATPQSADFRLSADGGNESFNHAQSGFDAADLVAASETSRPATTGAFADASSDLSEALVQERVLHAAGCACAACRGGSADSQLASGVGPGDDLSAASLGTLDQLADYLETQFWSDYGTSNRNFNLSATGTYAKDGDLTYNTSGNSQDSNGLSSGRADLVDEAFKLF